MVSIISMNVNKTINFPLHRFIIVQWRLWNTVHGSNLNWNRCMLTCLYLFCIKDNHGRQAEPAILISRLLLRMHCMYVAIHLDFHKECMECTERTLSSDVHLDLISLVITYILTTTQSTALDQSESVLTFNHCHSQSATFITSNI